MVFRFLQGPVIILGALVIAIVASAPTSLTVAGYDPPGGSPPGGLTGTTGVWPI